MTAVDVQEPVPGQPCPVCGLPDPEHDWDAHDRQQASHQLPARFGAALPNMLARSSTRGKHAVRVLALHTTEGILKARDLRAWAGWPGSSHASADADGVLLSPADGFVPYHLAAWTLRSGNPWSENIELCGFAKWTRKDWAARPRLLEAAARWLADRHKARGIPLRKLTPQEYRAGASGVIAHHDHTVGYRDGTHWDVGTAFPWDVVLPRAQQIANGEDEDMNADQDRKLSELHAAVAQIRGQIMGPLEEGQGRSLVQSLNWWLTQDGSPLLMAAARAGDPEAMAGALANALGPRLAEQLRGVAGLTQQQALDASKQAVREVLGGLG